MTLDEILTQVDATASLMMGRTQRGWSRLDVTADGFLNSFYAIPVCFPAFLVTWLSHAAWIAQGGGTRSVGYIVIALGVLELLGWASMIALFFVLANAMRWRDRFVPVVVGVNWALVVVAYMQAVPATMALVMGLGEGIAFISLIVIVVTLVAFARVLNATMERPIPVVGGVFLATVALSLLVTSWGHALFGIFDAAEPLSDLPQA